MAAADMHASCLGPNIDWAFRASLIIAAICAAVCLLTLSASFLVAVPQFCAKNVDAIVLSLPEYSFSVLGVGILPLKAWIVLHVMSPCLTSHSARSSYIYDVINLGVFSCQ